MAGNAEVPQIGLDAIITAASHLRIQLSMGLVALVIIWFDYFLTIADEVELIWKRKRSPLSILFLINRYMTPCGMAVQVSAMFYRQWTSTSCSRFAKFPGALTIMTVLIAELILILRVYAVHDRRKWTLAVLIPIAFTQISMMSWSLARSGPFVIPHNSAVWGCVLAADPRSVNVTMAAMFWLVPSLVFDTTVLILLILPRSQHGGLRNSLYHTIILDGAIYFVAVFASNVAWAVTALTLPTDLQQVLASFSTIMTNVMIGRLTLNLRKKSTESRVFDVAPITGGCFAMKAISESHCESGGEASNSKW